MSFVRADTRGGAIRIRLDRPERHNSLIPELVQDLRDAIADAAAREPVALVLSGRGSSFSTGGDIAGFLDHSGSHGELSAYAERLVSGLHDAILDLLAFPAPVLAAINGPVTGGSAGLMLAADLVAMAEHAFVQPYYSEVGFGPDGGWTALLPERIGTAKALEILYRNARISAEEAARLGLAAHVCPACDMEARIDAWIADLNAGFLQSHRAARQTVWDAPRRDTVRRRLELEKVRFMELITRPETLQGMKDFTRKRA